MVAATVMSLLGVLPPAVHIITPSTVPGYCPEQRGTAAKRETEAPRQESDIGMHHSAFVPNNLWFP